MAIPERVPIEHEESRALNDRRQTARVVKISERRAKEPSEEVLSQADTLIDRIQKRTGSFIEATSWEAYIGILQEIDAVKINRPKETTEPISSAEKEFLLAVSLTRMRRTDATALQIGEQMAHLKEVFAIATKGATDSPDPIDLKTIQRAALLHDTCKFCASYRRGEKKDGTLQVVMSESVIGKPKANPDLLGHNAHSAIDALEILRKMKPPASMEEALAVAQAILAHSLNEFPHDLARLKGVPIRSAMGLEAYRLGSITFVTGAPKTPEARILHTADMMVGVGTESYFKYVEQHVNNAGIFSEDTEAMRDRGWTRVQSALQSCFETSGDNFFRSTVAAMRDKYGIAGLARTQAMREWFRHYGVKGTSALRKLKSSDRLVYDRIIQALDAINNGKYSTEQGRAAAVEGYRTLLEYAHDYLSGHERDRDFVPTYSQKFFQEHSVFCQDEFSYWRDTYQPEHSKAATGVESKDRASVVASRQRKRALKIEKIEQLLAVMKDGGYFL